MNVLSEVRDGVGESPSWDADAGCLWSVDITGRAIRRRWLDGRIENWATKDLPTAIALTRDGGDAVVSFASGVGAWAPERGVTHWIARPETDAQVRLNEGRRDPRGPFWVASTETNLTPGLRPCAQGAATGRLFSIESGEAMVLLGPELAIPNTMSWSPDRIRFYAGDPIRNRIWAWDHDDATGAISNRRVHVDGGPGLPDGSAMDAEVALWTARFGAACVICTPADGHRDRILDLPLTNPTACTFGGPGLSTLFVTSARFGLEAPSALDGATLAVGAEVEGLPENRWGAPRERGR